MQTDHDPASRPTEMRENGAASGPGVLASFAYDGLSRRTGLTRGNGTVTQYSFDTAGRLSGLNQDVASTAFDQAWTMAYNPAAQITALDGWNTAWTAPPIPPGSAAWAHDGLNRITGLSWDARGNLTGDGTRTFTYDLENRLLNVTSGGTNTAQLLYDPQGRPYRMGPSATPVFTLYSGPMLVAEYDAGGTLLRRHVPGPGVDEPLVTYEGAGTADRRWLHTDRQGSIAAWSGGSGVVTAGQISTYGPWGEPTAWAGPRYRYTGQIAMPEAQLYHYKARVYDPVLGRFLQTDPVGFEDQLNLYAYVAGDPVNRTDPTGEQTCRGSDAACAVVRGYVASARDAANQAMPRSERLDAVVAHAYDESPQGARFVVDTAVLGEGEFAPSTGEIHINPTFIEDSLRGGAVISHEVDHSLWNQENGPMENLQDRRDTEQSAYETENMYNRAVGQREVDVNRLVERSVEIACDGSSHATCR